MDKFDFGFDKRFRLPLMLIGVMPRTAHVSVDDEHLRARFGPWKLKTPLSNICCVQVTEDYRWYKAIGPRGSFADRGLTFGTNADRGVCVEFRTPVPALVPGDMFPHPAVTLTLADIDGFIAALKRRDITMDGNHS